MLRSIVRVGVFVIVGLWAVVPARSESVSVDNASFERPVVDHNGFPGVPVVEDWTETDLDTTAGTGIGVFANPSKDSPDHVANVDGRQLAYLGSEEGNRLEQALLGRYKEGWEYRLTVGVGISMRSPAAPGDSIELILYYRQDGDPVEIARRAVKAAGLSPALLQDFSLYLPKVGPDDAWAGKDIGVAIRAAGLPGGIWYLDNVRLTRWLPVSIPIENASFEVPAIDPHGYPAVPFVDGWREFDLDTVVSSDDGVFINTPPGSPDRIVNADGEQLAFLGSERGNSLEQDLAVTYHAGCVFRLTVALAFATESPAPADAPVDTMEIVLYYLDGSQPVDIVHQTVEAKGLSSAQLQDFSVDLPMVKPGEVWADKTVGVAIRAAGRPGGIWILDNLRLWESMPTSIPVENASFEAPAIDPSSFPAWPLVEGWLELDLDAAASANTGVFANTPIGSPDRMVNADGNQLAFLGSQKGNALEQELAATYRVGRNYRLTAAVGVSARFPPSAEPTEDAVELVLFYLFGAKPVDIVHQAVEAKGLSSTQVNDFSVYLPTVQPGDAWAGKPIGVAIRAAGKAGGFWDLDNVRLAESLPGDANGDNVVDARDLAVPSVVTP